MKPIPVKEVADILTFLIILIVLAVLLLLPFGVDGGYSGGVLQLSVKAGPFRIKLLPKKEKEPKAKRAKKKKKKDEGEKKKKEKKPLDFKKILQIIKLGLKALGRFRRQLNIDYIRLKYTVASDDPFNTAMQFASANAAVGTLCPLADRAFKIKQREVGIYSDFLADKPVIDFWLTATINLLDVFYIAFAFGIEFLGLIIKQKRYQAKKKREESKQERKLCKKERNEENGQASNR